MISTSKEMTLCYVVCHLLSLSSNIKTSGAVLFVAWINVQAGSGIHSSYEGGRTKPFATTYTLDYSSSWSETNFEEESNDEATCMSYP